MSCEIFLKAKKIFNSFPRNYIRESQTQCYLVLIRHFIEIPHKRLMPASHRVLLSKYLLHFISCFIISLKSILCSIMDVENNAWVTVNNDFWVTSEAICQWLRHSWNHWQIASRVTRKSLFTVTKVLFYFLHTILFTGTHISAKNNHRSIITQLPPMTVYSDFALWRHHRWSVTSCECQILALWRHICRLFLHAQIGAKAIFTSEKQPWISISHRPVFTA